MKKILQIPYVPIFPDWKDVPAYLKGKMQELEQEVSELQAIPDCVVTSDEVFWSRFIFQLGHPLSPRWVSNRLGITVADSDRTVEMERNLFESIQEGVVIALDSGDSKRFTSEMEKVASMALSKENVKTRRNAVGILPGNDGVEINFCDWRKVIDNLEDLYFNYRKSNLPKSASAIAFMISIINIHPFYDSNGRCSRAIFNAILNKNLKNKIFIPLKSIFKASEGGFEIRVMDLRLNNNWLPLIQYFKDAFFIMRKMAQGESSFKETF